MGRCCDVRRDHLVVLALGYLGYRYWKKRKAASGDAAYTPPPRPAHIIAIDELGALKAKKLWQQGHVKEYYSELTEILRRYFENRYTHAGARGDHG